MMLDTTNWKKFNLNELFDISYGNKFDCNKMTSNEGIVSFITRTGENNGLSMMVDYVDGIEPNKCGCITVALGGSIGASFVQSTEFYTGQNVAVLQPKIENIKYSHLLFISTLISHEAKTKFSAFGRELNKHIKNNFIIKLPITKNGFIDFCLIDDFMNEIVASIAEKHKTKIKEQFFSTCYGGLH